MQNGAAIVASDRATTRNQLAGHACPVELGRFALNKHELCSAEHNSCLLTTLFALQSKRSLAIR
jgi:hypothetical protein